MNFCKVMPEFIKNFVIVVGKSYNLNKINNEFEPCDKPSRCLFRTENITHFGA